MSDINAAIGLVQLKRFASFQKKRKVMAKNYDAILQKSKFLKIFKRDYNSITPHIYAVKLTEEGSREELQKYLLSKGIQTGYHYFPNHLLTYFKQKDLTLPVIENIFPNLLTLPSHTGVSKKNIIFIAKSIESFYLKN